LNSAFGDAAQIALTTGGANSAFGNAAQRALTIGGANSAFGNAAQRALTTGSGNSAFGNAAQQTLTTGGSNSAFGHTAQLSLTIGGANSAFGNAAQRALTTGDLNNAFGNAAQQALTTGGSNSAFSNSAQLSLTTGGWNSAFGTSAQRALTTGQRNTSIGFEATRNGDLSDSVHIGYRAGRDETRSNTFYLSNTETPTPLVYGEFDTRNLSLMGAPKSFGGGSGVVNLPNATTAPTSDPSSGVLLYALSGRLQFRGSSNPSSSGTLATLDDIDDAIASFGTIATQDASDVAITGGTAALTSATIGTLNSLVVGGGGSGTAMRIGYASTGAVAAGFNWFAQGLEAGQSNESGSNWFAQGREAGASNVSGSNWFAQGAGAGASNESGSNWIAQGTDAGRNNIGGSGWIAQGFEAAKNHPGNDFICIGYRAGRDETRSRTLYLSDSETPTPLIYGEFDTNNLSLMGAPKSFGGGSGVLNLPAATTAPTSDPTGNSVLIYVDPGSGRLKIRQANGADQFVALSAA
jgi:hypothetical protein